MKKDVVISVKTNQSYDDYSDKFEFVTPGTYCRKNSKHYLTYREAPFDGNDDTVTTLKIEQSVLTLIRFGKYNSQLIFEDGSRHLCHYETPQGYFTVGVMAKNMNIDINDTGGNIRVAYEIEVDSVRVNTNNLTISFREADSANDKSNQSD